MISTFSHDYSHIKKNNELLIEQNRMLKISSKRNFRLSIAALLFAGITALCNIYAISQMNNFSNTDNTEYLDPTDKTPSK